MGKRRAAARVGARVAAMEAPRAERAEGERRSSSQRSRSSGYGSRHSSDSTERSGTCRRRMGWCSLAATTGVVAVLAAAGVVGLRAVAGQARQRVAVRVERMGAVRAAARVVVTEVECSVAAWLVG